LIALAKHVPLEDSINQPSVAVTATYCRYSIHANARYTKTALTASVNVLGYEAFSLSVYFLTLITIVFVRCPQ
jgi:hypothetical protein